MHSYTTIQELIRTIQQKLAVGNSPLVITISGPSGSGKTTVVHQLTAALEEPVALLHTDDYYIGKTRMKTEMPEGESLNFDHPASLDLAHLAHDITTIRDHKTIHSPVYDMSISEPTSQTRLVQPARVIIIEGIASNLDEIRTYSTISVCVTAPVEVRLQRCIVRDATRNLRSESEVREHFAVNVIPSYEKYFLVADMATTYTIES